MCVITTRSRFHTHSWLIRFILLFLRRLNLKENNSLRLFRKIHKLSTNFKNLIQNNILKYINFICILIFNMSQNSINRDSTNMLGVNPIKHELKYIATSVLDFILIDAGMYFRLTH